MSKFSVRQTKSVTRGNEIFGKRIFAVSDRTCNLVISPFGAHSILTMTMTGARRHTLTEMKRVLGIPNENKAEEEYAELIRELNGLENVSFRMINKMYVPSLCRIKLEYRNIVENKFRSGIETVDFFNRTSAQNAVNKWIEKRPHSQSKNLISLRSTNENTNFILVNTIKLFVIWKYQFIEEDTRENDFYLLDGHKIKTDMMHQENVKYRYKSDKALDSEILEIPCAVSQMCVLIFLPSKNNNILQLEKRISTFDFLNYERNIHSEKFCREITIPRFKITSTVNMKDTLERVGLDIIFSEDANFAGISEVLKDSRISKVIQQVSFEISEDGIETIRPSVKSETSTFVSWSMVVNRPFIFALIYKKNLLFFGRVLNPRKSFEVHPSGTGKKL